MQFFFDRDIEMEEKKTRKDYLSETLKREEKDVRIRGWRREEKRMDNIRTSMWSGMMKNAANLRSPTSQRRIKRSPADRNPKWSLTESVSSNGKTPVCAELPVD